MRIVIASPPRSGNHWLRCLLARTYGLRELNGRKKAVIRPELWRHAADNRFPDGSIIHVHHRCLPRHCDAIEAVPAHIATILRDPYDTFVSFYHWVQTRDAHVRNMRMQQAGEANAAVEPDEDDDRAKAAMVGKPIDHPDVLAFLAEAYGRMIGRGVGWLESGRSQIVRYEDLHADPGAALADLTDRIQAVEPEAIAAATSGCGIEAMRGLMPHTVRTGRVGDARQELGEGHLRIFRERHADLVCRLGYPVR